MHHSHHLELSALVSDDGHCEVCDGHFGRECEKGSNPCSLNGEHSTLLINASPSLSSYGSCVLSSGNFQADPNTKTSFGEAVAIDTGHMQQCLLDYKELVEDLGGGNSSQNMDVQNSISNTSLTESRDPLSLEEHSVPSSLTVKSHDDNIDEKVNYCNATPGVAQSLEFGGDPHNMKYSLNSSKASLSPNAEGSLIWMPPEPDYMDSVINSVANNDDDDGDYCDVTRWGQPSLLSCLDEEQGSSYSYKEERQKVMMEVMNGQFKILVSHFLASARISLSDHDARGNWLEIVTSLSWVAALLVQPDAVEGRAMDPGSYVKVKCVGSGSRSQSQVIKGLVFKKSAAHKHMPTKFRNAKLLLLRGSLGHSTNGLSSFESMGQENDHLKSIIGMIETCHPNVVLVEKSVSRDIQESLLTKGITVVFDMKLPRLERIARCTGFQIVPFGDIMVRSSLHHCDSFHIEKFVEEHNSTGESGKKQAKTLMFLEGFPKPLGCTILLKGANSGELKKIKHVLHYTVFAAYHLIIETSFFIDQRTFFSDMNSLREVNYISGDDMVNSVDYDASLGTNFLGPKDSLAVSPPGYVTDIPIFNGSMIKTVNGSQCNPSEHAEGSLVLLGSCSECFGEKLTRGDDFNNGDILQSVSIVSAPVKRIQGENLPLLTSESISSYFGFGDNEGSTMVSPVVETFDYRKHLNKSVHEKLDSDFHIAGKTGNSSDPTQITEFQIERCAKEFELPNKGDLDSTLDPQSILVLMSIQCITKHVAFEESHLYRIKYYGNFDVSLGRYLQDILLSKKYSCSSCGNPSQTHIYRYTHQNGNLTAVVKELPPESTLPGEEEGKIWMWTHCLKCEHHKGVLKAGRRVVMSSVARGLPFGKFLDLSFSDHSAAKRLSRCGHLLHRDCLQFFGLGSKVAMFRYSPIEIYAACKPQPILGFCNQNGHDWLRKEAKDVIAKGELLYGEVADVLDNLKPHYASSILKQSDKFSEPMTQINEIENMLKQEKTAFEASLLDVLHKGVYQGESGNKILDFNWLIQELLFILYIWDRRLHFLLKCMGDFSNDAVRMELLQRDAGMVSSNKVIDGNVAGEGNETREPLLQVPVIVDESFSGGGNEHAGNHGIWEKELQIESAQFSCKQASCGEPISSDSCSSQHAGNLHGESPELAGEEHSARSIGNLYLIPSSDFEPSSNFEEVSIPIVDQLQEESYLPVSIVTLNDVEEAYEPEQMAKESCISNEKLDVSQQSYKSDAEDPERWIWSPFSQLRKAYRKDLHGGSLHKFQFINTYDPLYLPRVRKLFTKEHLLHFAVASGDNVISVVNDEISSIIACALALYKDHYGPVDNIAEKARKREADQAIDTLNRSDGSLSLSDCPFTGSLDSAGARSSSSVEVLSLPSAVSFIVDHNLHTEIILGSEKTGKNKYLVMCIYAKEFYSLRRKCCPSELAYISSLSRCKKWDAQGGKSKVFFAKTMDERFIIKQIKKTELDSFLKFGPEYFKYLSFSLDTGSQTCLAKILGIYRVRQFRNGKEIKTDLMVMENLLFGWNISRKYDLKGAIFSRYVSDPNNPDRVLLDENFVEDMRVSPIYIGGRTKHLMQRAIWNDTGFLTSINVMDYSLLVGVDQERHKLVFGIIDYVRQYTWDKQLETWVKSSLVVPKNASPTVVSPREYKIRFRKFMSKYFLTVPDTWGCNQHSDSGKSFLTCGSCSAALQEEYLQGQSLQACA